MNSPIWWPLCLVVWCWSHWSHAADAPAAPPIDIHAVIEDVTTDTRFNGAVLVSRAGHPDFHHYAGFADGERTTPLSAVHLFSPGSVGKEFTTVVIMQQVDKGLLGYADPLAKYLPTLPAWAQTVTVEHILTHTSGLPKIRWHKGISTDDAVRQINESTPAFEPGTDYLYSNLNVVLRALVAEAVANDSFANIVKTTVFDVAGMTNAYQQLDVAQASDQLVAGDFPTALNGVTVYVTPADLMKFERALTGERLLPWAEIANKLSGDRLSGQDHRAYFDFGHFQRDEAGRLLHWEHDGSNPSHHTLKHHNFQHGYTIVLMSSDGEKATLYKIRDALIEAFSSEIDSNV